VKETPVGRLEAVVLLLDLVSEERRHAANEAQLSGQPPGELEQIAVAGTLGRADRPVGELQQAHCFAGGRDRVP
jgi:hypothetical protein